MRRSLKDTQMQNLSLKKIAEFTTQNSNNLESRADSDSKESLDSSLSDSKQLTESTTSKNPSEALPNKINSACDSTSLAQLQNCTIFAQQKSNKYVGAIAPTISRPCRGGKA